MSLSFIACNFCIPSTGPCLISSRNIPGNEKLISYNQDEGNLKEEQGTFSILRVARVSSVIWAVFYSHRPAPHPCHLPKR